MRRILDRDGFRQFVGTSVVDTSEDDSPITLVMSAADRSALRDQARFTRDLPLTAFVPPADPPQAD